MTTIKDVAELAGVSIATVSHVVKKTRYVSPELSKKVEAVIADLETLPNFIVREQKKEQTALKIILVYISDPDSLFEKNMYLQIKSMYKGSSNLLILPIEYEDIKGSFDKLDYLLQDQIICQFILTSQNVLPEVSKKFDKIPTIFISPNGINAQNKRVVYSDSKNGIKQAVTHLIKNGHTKIAFLDFARNQHNDLILGYLEALQDHEIELDSALLSYSELNSDELDKRLKNWFLSNTPPTALLLSEKVISEVMVFFKKHNISIPKDVSIIALNECNWFRHYSPPISSLVHDYNNLCAKAIEQIKHPYKEHNLTKMAMNLNLRSSTSGIGRGPFGEKAASMEMIELTDSEVTVIKQKERTAVISFHYTGSSWMTLHEEGIKHVFEQLNIKIIGITDAFFNPDLQNKQIQSLLDLEPDIFIAIPTDNSKTAAAFKKIIDSPSKLILITNVPEGLTINDYVTVVSVNESSHGRLASQGLCEAMIAQQKNKVGLITFDSDFYATNQRDMAAKQLIIEEYPKINILSEVTFDHESEVYDRTMALVTEYPELEAIYISWDDPAKEALRALRDLDRHDIIIGTADLDHTLAMEMASGNTVKSISAQQAFEQGKAIGYAAGQAMLSKYVPSFIGIEPIAVSRTNLLQSWKQIFQEDPPNDLTKALEIEA